MNSEYMCKECGSRQLEVDIKGELACIDCGLVQSTMFLDEGPDWNNYNDGSESGEHTGMPSTELLHDKGLTTDIDWRNRDYAGSSMNKETSRLFRRLRRQHQRTRISNSTERNLAVALGELQRLGSQMDLPKSVKEEAAFIYRKAVEKKLVRGRSIEGVVAASIYAACRVRRIPRTLDEVGKHSRTGRKEIGRTFRAISRELLLKVAPATPQDYIPRFCSILNLPQTVETSASRILVRAEEIDLTASETTEGEPTEAVLIAENA